ncbi:MAG TPA: hypothetical protein VHG90_13090 [Acidimicrobiales bacterium]|nr:hypothetical protein [Acidimicrobiales bacterium]
MAESVKRKLTTGEIVILAGGAVALVASFLPWYEADGDGYSAWSSGLFPLATLVPILGTVMAVQILVDKLSGANMPRRLSDFTWEQIHLVAALVTAVLVFCYLVVDRGGVDLGFGFYLEMLAAAALVAGAVMIRKERPRAPGPVGF